MYSHFVVLTLIVVAPGPKDPPKKDVDPLLLGEWVHVKSELAGEAYPANDEILDFKADGKLITRHGMNAPEEGTYKANPKRSPAEVDFEITTSSGLVVTRAAIYTIEGDTLTLCLVADGERPTKFEATVDVPTQALMTYRRAKK